MSATGGGDGGRGMSLGAGAAGGESSTDGEFNFDTLLQYFKELGATSAETELASPATPGEAERVKNWLLAQQKKGKNTQKLGEEVYRSREESNGVQRPTAAEFTEIFNAVLEERDLTTILQRIFSAEVSPAAAAAPGLSPASSSASVDAGARGAAPGEELSAEEAARRAADKIRADELAGHVVGRGGAAVANSGNSHNVINVNVPPAAAAAPSASAGFSNEDLMKFLLEQQRQSHEMFMQMNHELNSRFAAMAGDPAKHIMYPQHYDPAAYHSPPHAAPAPAPAAATAPPPDAARSTAGTTYAAVSKPWNEEEIYKEIRRKPEAQMHGAEYAQSSQELVGKASDYAVERKPLVAVPGPVVSNEADGRKVFNVTPVKEGPIFMPRLDKNGSAVKENATGKIVYDILYYNADKSLNPAKSFIAQDGVPEGTRSSVIESVRNECLMYHGQQNHNKTQDLAKKLGWPPEERGNVMAQAVNVGQNVSGHVYTPPTAVPQPVPAAPTRHDGFVQGFHTGGAAGWRGSDDSASHGAAPPPPPPPPPMGGASGVPALPTGGAAGWRGSDDLASHGAAPPPPPAPPGGHKAVAAAIGAKAKEPAPKTKKTFAEEIKEKFTTKKIGPGFESLK